MEEYIKGMSENPAFVQDGLKGYRLNSSDPNVGLYYIDCLQGHDRYNLNKQSTQLYYILQGEGKFCINQEVFKVGEGDIIEISPNTEFVYAGQMKLIMIMQPDFKSKNVIDTKENDLS